MESDSSEYRMSGKQFPVSADKHSNRIDGDLEQNSGQCKRIYFSENYGIFRRTFAENAHLYLYWKNMLKLPDFDNKS